MDTSITLSPEGWQTRGAQARKQGVKEDGHKLPLNSDARRHWQYGWHMQRVQELQASWQLEGVCPP